MNAPSTVPAEATIEASMRERLALLERWLTLCQEYPLVHWLDSRDLVASFQAWVIDLERSHRRDTMAAAVSGAPPPAKKALAAPPPRAGATIPMPPGGAAPAPSSPPMGPVYACRTCPFETGEYSEILAHKCPARVQPPQTPVAAPALHVDPVIAANRAAAAGRVAANVARASVEPHTPAPQGAVAASPAGGGSTGAVPPVVAPAPAGAVPQASIDPTRHWRLRKAQEERLRDLVLNTRVGPLKVRRFLDRIHKDATDELTEAEAAELIAEIERATQPPKVQEGGSPSG